MYLILKISIVKELCLESDECHPSLRY